MQTTIVFLDAVKAKTGARSDYALSKILGITASEVSKLRLKKSFLGDSTAIKVAKLLDIDPAIVVACSHAERAKRADEKQVWQHIAKALGGAAATVLLAIGAATLPFPIAQAAAIPAGQCILC